MVTDARWRVNLLRFEPKREDSTPEPDASNDISVEDVDLATEPRAILVRFRRTRSADCFQKSGH